MQVLQELPTGIRGIRQSDVIGMSSNRSSTCNTSHEYLIAVAVLSTRVRHKQHESLQRLPSSVLALAHDRAPLAKHTLADQPGWISGGIGVMTLCCARNRANAPIPANWLKIDGMRRTGTASNEQAIEATSTLQP